MWTKKIICHIQTFLLTVHFCCICVYFSAYFYHETETLSPCVCKCVCMCVCLCVRVCLIIASVVAYTHTTHNTRRQHTIPTRLRSHSIATWVRRPSSPFPSVLSTFPCHPPLPALCHCCTPIRAIAQNAKFSPFSLFVSFHIFLLSFSIIFIYIHMYINVYIDMC